MVDVSYVATCLSVFEQLPILSCSEECIDCVCGADDRVNNQRTVLLLGYNTRAKLQFQDNKFSPFV